MTPRSYVDALFDELAAILAALHAWTPPPEIATLMHDRPQLDLADPLSVWAADLVALPIPALAAGLVRALAHVDPALVDAAVERIRSLAGADALATPREPWVVVHGAIGRAEAGSALLDFEWARWGRPIERSSGWRRPRSRAGVAAGGLPAVFARPTSSGGSGSTSSATCCAA